MWHYIYVGNYTRYISSLHDNNSCRKLHLLYYKSEQFPATHGKSGSVGNISVGLYFKCNISWGNWTFKLIPLWSIVLIKNLSCQKRSPRLVVLNVRNCKYSITSSWTYFLDSLHLTKYDMMNAQVNGRDNSFYHIYHIYHANVSMYLNHNYWTENWCHLAENRYNLKLK